MFKITNVTTTPLRSVCRRKNEEVFIHHIVSRISNLYENIFYFNEDKKYILDSLEYEQTEVPSNMTSINDSITRKGKLVVYR